MTIKEIKYAVDAGITVYYCGDDTIVIKGKTQYWLYCQDSNFDFDMLWLDGDIIRLQGKEENYYTKISINTM